MSVQINDHWMFFAGGWNQQANTNLRSSFLINAEGTIDCSCAKMTKVDIISRKDYFYLKVQLKLALQSQEALLMAVELF